MIASMPRATRRRMSRLAVLVLLAAIALPASAADQYSDVPGDALHHDATTRLAAAGIAAGCETDPPRYCPDQPLPRRQMALFLDRLAGRAAGAASATTLESAAGGGLGGTVVSTSITSGGVAGGTGWVVLQGSVSVTATDGLQACPCEVEAFVYRVDDDTKGPISLGQLPSQPSSSGRAAVSLPVTWRIQIPSATTATYAIGVFVTGSPSGARAEGTLTAIWAPYGP